MPARGADRTVYSIRAVERVCDLLDALRGQTLGLADLSDASGMPRSTTLRYLSSLEVRGYVSRDQEGLLYALGPTMLRPSTSVIGQIADATLQPLMELRDHFEETVNLGVLDADEVVHAQVAEATRAVRLSASRGQRAHIHSTAMGKVLASRLGEEQVRRVLQRKGMPSFAARTITDPDRYLMALVDVARQGYGVDDCENQPDGRCVAVPVDGLPFGVAVSVSAPASRLSLEQVPGIAHDLQSRLEPLKASLTRIALG